MNVTIYKHNGSQILGDILLVRTPKMIKTKPNINKWAHNVNVLFNERHNPDKLVVECTVFLTNRVAKNLINKICNKLENKPKQLIFLKRSRKK